LPASCFYPTIYILFIVTLNDKIASKNNETVYIKITKIFIEMVLKPEPDSNSCVASTAWANGSAYPIASNTPPIIFSGVHAPQNKPIAVTSKEPIPDT